MHRFGRRAALPAGGWDSFERIEAQLVGLSGWRERLKAAMWLRGVTQQQCADAGGLSGRTYSYMMRSATASPPEYAVAIKIAGFLNVDPDVLWCVSDAEPVSRSRVELRPRWRRFAQIHEMTPAQLVEQAVEEYIETAILAEQAYCPTRPDDHVDGDGIVVMTQKHLRSLLLLTEELAAPEPEWVDHGVVEHEYETGRV